MQLWVVFSFLTLSLPSWCSYEESLAKCQEQEEAQSLVKEGIELFNADQFKEARDKFEDACDKDPENEDAEAWLAKAKAALKPKRRERSHTVVAVQKDEVVTVRHRPCP